MGNRQKQRELREQRKLEESVGKRSGCDYKDLTPYSAVRQIRTNGKANITLK